MSKEGIITLGHGSGGRLTQKIIQELILKKFKSPYLKDLDDSAYLKSHGLLFTSDSFVISPTTFPGGDIGKLAICGTVNDLSVCAAVPLYVSLNMIVQEGMSLSAFTRIMQSISKYEKESGVHVVCGDFKVIEKRKKDDDIFISTSGLGKRIKKAHPHLKRIKPKDKIIINGYIADHGISVMLAREKIFEFSIKSDCDFLSGLLTPLWKNFPGIKFGRDPTRGGLVSSLNEIAQQTQLGIKIYEEKVPLRKQTSAACELLGLDPFYIANEGKVILVVEQRCADAALQAMKRHPKGKYASIIGEVTDRIDKVVLETTSGGERILDMLSGFPLPRIC